MSAADRRVAVVGAGLVGSSWAAVFARAGYHVSVYDESAAVIDEARSRIGEILDQLDRSGLLDESVATMLGNVSPSRNLSDALSGAGYVQECTPEVLDVKRDVVTEIAAAADPLAVIASSTSGFAPSTFTADVGGRERCVVAHPINPAHLHDVVEVIPAPWTASHTISETVAVLREASLEPIVLRSEVDGFLVNRLQSAILHEAFRLVADGVASVAAVDRAVVGALAPRWSIMGPFETIDLNAPGGVADYVARYEPMYERLAATQNRIVSWCDVVEAGLAEEVAQTYGTDRAARVVSRDRQLAGLAVQRRALAAKTDGS